LREGEGGVMAAGFQRAVGLNKLVEKEWRSGGRVASF